MTASIGGPPVGSRGWRHRHIITVFAIIAPLYFVWTWSDQIGFLGSDGPAYLVMAQHYSGDSRADSAIGLAGTFSRFPPLYAIALARLHATKELVRAHAATTAFLLAGLVAMYGLLCSEGLRASEAALLTLLFAMLRGSWLLALSLQSEFLYLLLSCIALLCMSAYHRGRRNELLFAAALAVAAAVLTRAIGVALLVPLALAALRAPPRSAIVAAAIALAPLLLWHLLHKSGMTYTESLNLFYSGDPWSLLAQQIRTELSALREGLESSVVLGGGLRGMIDTLGVLSLAATVYRAAHLKSDALYLTVYLGIVLTVPPRDPVSVPQPQCRAVQARSHSNVGLRAAAG